MQKVNVGDDPADETAHELPVLVAEAEGELVLVPGRVELAVDELGCIRRRELVREHGLLLLLGRSLAGIVPIGRLEQRQPLARHDQHAGLDQPIGMVGQTMLPENVGAELLVRPAGSQPAIGSGEHRVAQERVVPGGTHAARGEAVEDVRRQRIDDDVRVDPDESIAISQLIDRSDKQLLPAEAAALGEWTLVQRPVDYEEAEAVPGRVGLPVALAEALPEVAIAVADDHGDDGGLAHGAELATALATVE